MQPAAPATHFNGACRNNEGDKVRALLEQYPAEHAVFARCANAGMEQLAKNNCHAVIPVIAEYFPETVDIPNDRGDTPFIIAARQGKTEAMLALAKAGANIHAQSGTRAPGAYGAMSLACGSQYVTGHVQTAGHVAAARSLGLDINKPDPDGLSSPARALASQPWRNMRHIFEAGANVYQALRIAPPADPGKPDYAAIIKAYNAQRHPGSTNIEEARTGLLEHVKSACALLPPPGQPLGPEFFTRSGKLLPAILKLDSIGALPLLFSMDAPWKGGRGQMIETAQALPAYLHDSINLTRTLRNTPTPREESVTVAYAHNKLAQRRTLI